MKIFYDLNSYVDFMNSNNDIQHKKEYKKQFSRYLSEEKKRCIQNYDQLINESKYDAIKKLGSLNIRLNYQEVNYLWSNTESSILNSIEWTKLVAKSIEGLRGLKYIQDDFKSMFHKLSGPDTDIKIYPEKKSKFKFDRWKHLRVYKNNKFEEDEFFYKNCNLKTGDILCCDTNVVAGGMYSYAIFVDTVYIHAAIFVMIDNIPSIVEIHEKGVRAVPVSRFFSKDFNLNIDIYRCTENLSIVQKNKIKLIAYELVIRDNGFDFENNNLNHDYFSCCSLIEYIYTSVGIQIDLPSYSYSKYGVQAMAEMGVLVNRVVLPTSILESDKFKLVGYWDNDEFSKGLLNHYTCSLFSSLFSTRELKFSRMGSFNVFLLSIGNYIDNTSFVRRLLIILFGFNSRNFPKASFKLIIFSLILDRKLKNISKSLTYNNDKWIIEKERNKYYSSLENWFD